MAFIDQVNLSGKHALVTGSSRGIGRAIVLGLAEQGADVVIHFGRDKDSAESARQAAEACNVRAYTVQADMADPAGPKKLYDESTAALGHIDILVLNVSVNNRKPWQQQSVDDFDWQMRVNLRSAMELMQLAVPAMVEQKWGRILTVGSVQEVRPHPDMLIYAASKCAQTSMVFNLAKQLAPFNVTVNNLAPGVIDTDRNTEALSNAEYRSTVISKIPAQYVGEPEDCVGAAILMCSDAGRYITGTSLLVDGGMHL